MAATFLILGLVLLATAKDDATALDQELYDACAQKVPPVPLADVEALLEKGANASFIGEYDYTPLMWAAYLGYAGLARLYVKHGADVSLEDEEDRTNHGRLQTVTDPRSTTEGSPSSRDPRP